MVYVQYSDSVPLYILFYIQYSISILCSIFNTATLYYVQYAIYIATILSALYSTPCLYIPTTAAILDKYFSRIVLHLLFFFLLTILLDHLVRV